MNIKNEKQEWLRLFPEELNERSIQVSNELITFGTGGLRGLMGFGNDKINRYTVSLVMKAISKIYSDDPVKKIVIAYDGRKNAYLYAVQAANILIAEGYEVRIFSEPAPTPLLIYAMKYLGKTTCGVMVTASHNNKLYNGIKIYDKEGYQATPEQTHRIDKEMKIISEHYKHYDLEPTVISDPKISWIGETADRGYLDILRKYEKKRIEKVSNIPITYSSLHGTGIRLVPRALNENGFKTVTIVEEQSDIDPLFRTVDTPNPEEIEEYEISKKVAMLNGSKLILVTDSDADRLGVMTFHNNEFVFINGNQLGTLIIYYYVKEKQDLKQNLVLKSMVSTKLVNKIAKDHEIKVKDFPTGFKFMGQYLSENRAEEVLFSFEESNGFLQHPFIYDKDAIQAALLISQITSFYLQKNKSLLDVLEDIYQEYGYSITNQIKKEKDVDFRSVTQALIDNMLTKSNDVSIKKVTDYRNNRIYKGNTVTKTEKDWCLDLINVEFDFGWIAIRPSGTEKVTKVYLEAFGETKLKAESNSKALQKFVSKLF